jgi:hypothetical protein
LQGHSVGTGREPEKANQTKENYNMSACKLTHSALHLGNTGQMTISGDNFGGKRIDTVGAAAVGGARQSGAGYVTVLLGTLDTSAFSPTLHLSLSDADKLRRVLGRAIRDAKKASESAKFDAEAAAFKTAMTPRKAATPAPKPAEINGKPIDARKFSDAVEATRGDQGYDGIRASESRVNTLEQGIGTLEEEMKRIESQLGKGIPETESDSDPSADVFIIGAREGAEIAHSRPKAIPAPVQAVPGLWVINEDAYADQAQDSYERHSAAVNDSNPADKVFYITK